MRVIAPFQPTCFPPAYIFQRALTADCVVLMESAQMTPFSPGEDGAKKHTWQKHFRIGGNGPVCDVVIPTTASMLPIKDTPLDSQSKWRDNVIKTLKQRYSKAEDTNTITSLIAFCLESAQTLGELNSLAFRQICSLLRITTEICTDSIADKATKQDWVINLVQAAGGDTLLTGKPSTAYMDAARFADSGITIVVQDWQQPEYQHYGKSKPNMSIIHTLYSLGVNRTIDFLRA